MFKLQRPSKCFFGDQLHTEACQQYVAREGEYGYHAHTIKAIPVGTEVTVSYGAGYFEGSCICEDCQ